MLKRLRLAASFALSTGFLAFQSEMTPVRGQHVCDDIQTHCSNYCSTDPIDNCEFFCPCYWGCRCGGGENCVSVCGS
jgi:hypothetical protein